MRPPTRGLAFAALALGLAAASCGGGPEDAEEVWPGAPVVLISIDTLRADRLPAYGYDRVDTPNFDALRADGILFERAFSHVPLTLPSHASLFTGLLPSEHGVRDNSGYKIDGESMPLLQRSLQDAGYATGAGISAAVLLRGKGLDTAFDFYDDEIRYPDRPTGLGGLQRPGEETLQAVLPWLREVSDRPFYLFFHIYEPHSPYDPQEPFASRYDSAYDGEVASADEIVGDLLDELKRLEAYDRALIVLLSDHGEGLEEHGETEHGVFLYDTTLRVPMLVKLPGSARAGSSVPEPVQLADVFPTVVSLVGADVPDGLAGEIILGRAAELDPDRPIYSESYFGRLQYGWSELLSVLRGRYHYVDGPEPELFDLQVDPGETRNVVADRPDLRNEFRTIVGRFRTDLEPPGEVDPETAERLAALGYIGGATVDLEGPLPDPRGRKEDLRDINRGFQKFYAEQWGESVHAFRRVLKNNPQVKGAWHTLARSLDRLGREDEAIAACIEGLRHNPDASGIALTAAKLFFRIGRYPEARAHAELVTGSAEGEARVLLGRIAVLRGDFPEARRQADLARDAGREGVHQKLILAEVAVARKKYSEALAIVGEIEELRSTADTGVAKVDEPGLGRPPKGLYYVKGESLANLGRTDEAEEEFLREIELFPDELRAYTHLSVLRMVLGRPEQAHRTLQEMLDANPTAAAYAEAVRTLRVVGDQRTADLVLRNARSRFPGNEALRNL